MSAIPHPAASPSPPAPPAPPAPLGRAYWLVALALAVAALGLGAAYAPTEATMGPVQKIFYVHLPAATLMFAACAGVFVAGLGYAWQRSDRWEDLGLAAAEAAAVLGAVVLLTGMAWARRAWGHWWTWSPRLTFSLVLWVLYGSYVLLHRSMAPGPRRALACALYGMIAFLDVPLVYLSTKLLPDVHPAEVRLDPRMRATLAVCFVPAVLLTAGLVHARYRRARHARAVAAPG